MTCLPFINLTKDQLKMFENDLWGNGIKYDPELVIVQTEGRHMGRTVTLFKRIMAFAMVLCLAVCQCSFEAKASSDNYATRQMDGKTCEYVSEKCKIVFSATDSWNNGHNVAVTIINSGNSSIRDWKCCFDYDATIVNAWNAEMVSNDETGEKEAYYCTWNRELMPGSSCSFGFSCSGVFKGFPQRCYIETGVFEESTGCDIDVVIKQSWNGGSTGEVVIRNGSDSDIPDWMLEFDTQLQVDSVWNGIVKSRTGEHFVISSADYNCRIPSNGSVTVGFQVRGEANGGLFSNLCLKTVRYGESEAESNEQDNPNDGKDQNSDANETEANESDDANENGNDPNEGNSDMNSGDDHGENNDEELVTVINDDEIGEMYYKPARKEDLVTDAEMGICYVGNQILVSAVSNTSKESLVSLFEECGATVIGFIELTNDFQIEFAEDKTNSELKAFIEKFEESDLIASASLNISNEMKGDSSWTEYECNDELYNDGYIARNVGGHKTEYYKDKDPDELTDARFHGDNWALKELNVPNAWKLVGKSVEPVRVGILDVGFVEGGHEDLSALHVYNNCDDKRQHGTHVAGIIGADHNEIGIAGVATNVQMYGWTSDEVDSVMGDKVALATLVGKHVRVINYSVGYKDYIAYSIQMETSRASILVNEKRKIYTEFLCKLYQQGYDFVIVTAAGNGNNIKYSVSPDLSGMYLVDNKGKRIREIEARNNSEYNSIMDPYLMSRIIVVASTRPEKPGMLNDVLVSGFNCVGERVDVYAPGEDILSTVPIETEGTDIPGYKMDQGTSFAAPHISGIAALMYQANPDLRADQVKQIICADENSIGSYTDSMGVIRNMPDAEKCVRAALEMKNGEQTTNPKKIGIVIGRIQLSDGSESGIVKALLTENNLSTPWENDTYEFSSTTDGTVVCSVPEGIYKLVIQKDGYVSLTIWDIEVKSEETNDLGVMELTRIPQLMQLKGWISHLRQGIPGTTIRIRQGLRNKTGEYLKDGNGVVIEASSDENGYYDVEILEGEYTFEFSKDGYAPEYYSVRMEPDKTGKQTVERDIDVMYKYDEVYKIVLDWRYSSVDLDIAASVISYGRNVARVQPKKNDNWLIYPDIRVLKDVKDGSESEIILIANADEILNGDKIYLAISVSDEGCRAGTFCGLHYSTQAKISLYKGEKLLQVFEVPRDIDRRVWYAFNIKEGDKIEVVNRNTDAIP